MKSNAIKQLHSTQQEILVNYITRHIQFLVVIIYGTNLKTAVQ